MREELLKGLSEEQIAKLKTCKSQEEILKVAKEEGVELTDEQLEAVSGGGSCAAKLPPCPNCQSENTDLVLRTDSVKECECLNCGHKWIIS